MSRRVSRPTIIGALLRKELTAYSRDLVYLGLTIALLVAIPVLFRLLPDSVEKVIDQAIASLDDLGLDDAIEDGARQFGVASSGSSVRACFSPTMACAASAIALVTGISRKTIRNC